MRILSFFNDSLCVININGAILLTPEGCNAQLTLCTGDIHWHHVIEDFDKEQPIIVDFLNELNLFGFSKTYIFHFYNDEYLLNNEYEEGDL